MRTVVGRARASERRNAENGGRATLADDLLQLMRQQGKPIGAHELIALLKARRGKRPNIYKSLNALAALGQIVRLASLRRYWALPEAPPKPAILLACGGCGRVELAASERLRRALSRKGLGQGFVAASIELPGRCRLCTGAAPDTLRNGGPPR